MNGRLELMKNQQVARIFNELAQLLELKGESIFRITGLPQGRTEHRRFFQGCSRLLGGRPDADPGHRQGPGRQDRRILRNGQGRVPMKKCSGRSPRACSRCPAIPGLGPKTAKMFYEQAKIKSIDELEALARAGKLAGMKGIQKKTEENILKGIEQLGPGQPRAGI